MSLIVVTPSRGRPQKALESYEKFLEYKSLEDTKMVFVVDKDDDTFDEYVKTMVPIVSYDHSGGGMGPPMNAAAADLAPMYEIVGFLGDDHRFRTRYFDEQIETALAGGGFAYGNDLARKDIPTQVFITSDIIQALGYFCLPGAYHLYLDNTWADLGNGAECLYYLPDTIIEHAHAFYGKAQMDEGYERVNHPSMYQHDAQIYRKWVESGQRERDIETVRKCL